jgi:protein SCO1/2
VTDSPKEPALRAFADLCMAACVAACVAAGAPAAVLADGVAPRLKAGSFEPARAAPDFVLSGSDGHPLRLSKLHGKVVLMSFGFTHCPAVCPTTLATLAEARRSLGNDAGAVQVVFVTVDPERDDAARLKAYVGAFDPTFLGATGSADALAAVRRSYGVVARRAPLGEGYGMDHSSSIFLIDRDGRLRAQMPYGRDARDFAHDVRLLLAS